MVEPLKEPGAPLAKTRLSLVTERAMARRMMTSALGVMRPFRSG